MRHRSPVTVVDVSWSVIAIMSAALGALLILMGAGGVGQVREAVFVAAAPSAPSAAPAATAELSRPVDIRTLGGVTISASKRPGKGPTTKTSSRPAGSPKASRTPAPRRTSTPTGRVYSNCTDLRKDFPAGVPSGHPAYRPKLDRDSDGWACEPSATITSTPAPVTVEPDSD